MPKPLHQSLSFQHEKRVVDGTTADVQPLGDLLLTQMLVRRQLTIEDRLSQPLGHEVA